MILTPERLKPFLLHEDQFIREAVSEYFEEGTFDDPEPLALCLEGLRRYGEASSVMPVIRAESMKTSPGALALALELLPAIERERIQFSLSSILAKGPVEWLREQGVQILQTPGFHPRCQARLQRRPEVATWSDEKLWQELQEFAARNDGTWEVGKIDHEYAHDLIEALATRSFPAAGTIVERLADGLAEEETWFEVFLVDLIGERRLVEGIPELLDILADDGEYIMDRATRALGRIGGAETVRQSRVRFAQTENDSTRNYLTEVFNRLKLPETEEAILSLLPHEQDATTETFLCHSLIKLFSDRAIEVILPIIERGYDRWILSLEDALLVVADVLGVELPQGASWRAGRAEQEKKDQQLAERLAKTGGAGLFSPAPARPAPPPLFPPRRGQPAPTPGVLPRQARHVGRNDPCPCGSGKKFKKCCGKNQ